MKSIAKGYLKGIDILNKIMGAVLMIMLAFMTAIIFWQVFSRFVIGSSLSWSEELSRYLMIYMVLIGSSIALRKTELISVDILLEVVKGVPRKIVIIVIQIFSILFCLVLIMYGYKMAQGFSNQLAPSLHISMKYIYLSLPLGGVLILLNSIANIIEQLVGKEVKE